MIAAFFSLMDSEDIFIIVLFFVALGAIVEAWWEFYAKPSRDSLAEIARCLNAAPWMQIHNAQRKPGKAA